MSSVPEIWMRGRYVDTAFSCWNGTSLQRGHPASLTSVAGLFTEPETMWWRLPACRN